MTEAPTNPLSRRALLCAAPAIPVAAMAGPASADILDWQQYIIDITRDLDATGQRWMRIAAESAADVEARPFEPGPIERLLTEYRRRERIICDGANSADGEISPEELDWSDEPLKKALQLTPDTVREFAAMFLLAHLDDVITADNLARGMFRRCEQMLA